MNVFQDILEVCTMYTVLELWGLVIGNTVTALAYAGISWDLYRRGLVPLRVRLAREGVRHAVPVPGWLPGWVLRFMPGGGAGIILMMLKIVAAFIAFCGMYHALHALRLFIPSMVWLESAWGAGALAPVSLAAWPVVRGGLGAVVSGYDRLRVVEAGVNAREEMLSRLELGGFDWNGQAPIEWDDRSAALFGFDGGGTFKYNDWAALVENPRELARAQAVFYGVFDQGPGHTYSDCIRYRINGRARTMLHVGRTYRHPETGQVHLQGATIDITGGAGIADQIGSLTRELAQAREEIEAAHLRFKAYRETVEGTRGG